MATATNSSTRNGKTVYLRLMKAFETCHKKYGDRAKYAIEGILRRQLGDDMTVAAFRDIVATGQFWKLDIQSQRAQHMAAQEKKNALELLDLLIDGVVASTPSGTAETHNIDEAVPFM